MENINASKQQFKEFKFSFSDLKGKLREELKRELEKREDVSEILLNELIAFLLPKMMKKEIWRKPNLNLQNIIKKEEIGKIFNKKYPDLPLREIDILYCRKNGKQKTTPINAIEIKFLKKFEKFYQGLGQAMSLLAYGFDTVELWHIFLIPRRKWGKLEEEKLNREIEKHKGKFNAFIGINQGLLESLAVPIGYRGWIIWLPNPKWKEKEIILWLSTSFLEPRHNPIVFNEIPLGMRRLICEKLNIVDESHYEYFWWNENRHKK